jgi:2-(1,2-epoxy-1,2-dihydrophenyl)acetyl-CoA isomerase
MACWPRSSARPPRTCGRLCWLAGDGRSAPVTISRNRRPSRTRPRPGSGCQRIQDVTRAIRALPAPVIAAVHGYALGAGAEFALGCDLVVASQDARFGFPEVGVGLSVTGGISALLPHTVGLVRAKELLFLGEHLSAEDAHRLGLVNRVVPAGMHEQAALDLAVRLAEQPPAALALAKSLLDRGGGLDGGRGLRAGGRRGAGDDGHRGGADCC